MSQKMTPPEPARPASFVANLRAGDYGFVARAGRIVGNVGRKIVRRSACCGNYGDPGC
jgi:hypothetical protein